MKHFKKVIGLLLTLTLLITLLPAVTETTKAATKKNIVAYFPNWGIYNASHRNMTVGMMPWDKITVINHAFFEVDSSFKLASLDTFADFDKMMEHSEGWEANQLRGHFGEYKYYKNLYPNVKVILSVGGWTRGQNFHAMASTASNRAIFIQSVINFLKTYPFIDGIDLDWEYPGINRAPDPNDSYDRGCPGGPEDKQNFTSLLREIRQAYNNNGLSDKLLTIAIPSGYDKLELQEPNIYAQYLDWLNVMTYDMHGAWENITNHQSPLYANPNDPSGTSPVDIKNRYNIDSIMKTLVEEYNIPAEKLNVGTPYYSRGWKGVTGGTNGMYGTATGAATGSWDNPQSPGGQYPYFTLKTMENQNGYTKYTDNVYAKAPWLYNASQGIVLTYEDATSLNTKCDYINSNGYGGLIIWEITGDTTDFELTNLAFQKLIGSTTQTVASPVFSLASGTYTSPQTVAITSVTAGAEIRYTTNGNEPTSSSTLYQAPLTVSSTTTIKAKAFKSGMTNSSTVTATYTIGSAQTVATPVFSLAEGTYPSAQTVSISSTTSGSEIRYTTNGSEPTSSSALYQTPLTVSATTTIKAKAFKSGMTDSATATAIYTINSNQTNAWTTGIAYKVGDIVTYNGLSYKCIQPHTSLEGWTPAAVPALWSKVS